MPGYLITIADWPNEFIPTGNIQSATITGALVELDNEKGDISGENWTGNHLFTSSSVIFIGSSVNFSSASVTGIQGLGLGAVGGGSDKVFYENEKTITTDYTITNNKNAMTVGPVIINNGITVTVPSGSIWSII